MTPTRSGPRVRALLVMGPLLFAPLFAATIARAGTLTPGSLDSNELTVAAIPSDTVRATVRTASATGFRPAPVPDERLVQPEAAKTDDAGTLHPELLSPQEVGGGGAMSTASSEYDHNARFRPAGGMGVTIPMQ